MSEESYYCPDCRLHWYWIGNGEAEFRLFMFVPINIKKCPFCSDPSKKIPKELIEFRKKV